MRESPGIADSVRVLRRIRAFGYLMSRSRRNFIKSLALFPLGAQSLKAQVQASAKCCESSADAFRPDDLFAPTSLAQDLASARQGDITATIRLGFGYYTGLAGRADLQRARDWFLAAAAKSLAGAAWLGYLDAAIRKGPGLLVRRRASFQGLQEAAIRGDPVGMTLLGIVYELGMAGYRPNARRAKAYYAAAAPHFALAKTCLGRRLAKEGAQEQAAQLFEGAVAAGETTGMIALADLYSRRAQPPFKATEIKRLLRMAADRRDRVALYLLGAQYCKERKSPEEYPQLALNLLYESASLGYRPAQVALADACAKGATGPNSAVWARFWARKASLPSLSRAWPPA